MGRDQINPWGIESRKYHHAVLFLFLQKFEKHSYHGNRRKTIGLVKEPPFMLDVLSYYAF